MTTACAWVRISNYSLVQPTFAAPAAGALPAASLDAMQITGKAIGANMPQKPTGAGQIKQGH
jgi:hypothetical protein